MSRRGSAARRSASVLVGPAGLTLQGLLVAAVLGATGCYRWVDVAPPAATALSSPTDPPQDPVVVRTIEGERRELDGFDAVIVRGRACSEPRCRKEEVKFLPPLLIEQRGETLRFMATNDERTFEHGSIERVTVRELAPGRTAVVGGVAIGVGLALGYLAYRAVGGCEEPSTNEGEGGYGCGGFYVGALTAGAAGSLTLLVTLPLTKPLGRRVD